MYKYEWDAETGGVLLLPEQEKVSLEPRPVYYRELDILGFDKYWNYPKDDDTPLLWATANNYFYRGRLVAKAKGGALYTPPKIELVEEPEKDGMPLRPVDIFGMTAKNAALMETLEQETIQGIYNTYVKYRKKVDVFYVAFSGGKDSVVTLDLVQRALPHGEFVVLFGDTGMELPDTYDVIDKTERLCKEQDIVFYRAESKFTPEQSWKLVGPPAQKLRWCCGVHKTAPQILFLRKLTNNPHFIGMAMMGVRSNESVTRGQYNKLNFGTKHQGQYDFYPIFEWSSFEVFQYIYDKKLELNRTYKLGNSRAGCLVCPMEAVKNSWLKEQFYSGECANKHTTTFFHNIIVNETIAHDMTDSQIEEFMRIGVWKSRHNGSKLFSPRVEYQDEKDDHGIAITLNVVRTDWREWLKTIGEISFISNSEVNIICENKTYTLEYRKIEGKYFFAVHGLIRSRLDINFASWIKIVMKKSAYCIGCQVCETNCPNGYIHFDGNKVSIDDKCTKCKKCYGVNGGCWVATSQLLPKGSGKMSGSIDQYKNMGIRYMWVKEYFQKENDFWKDNQLGSEMVKSLRLFLRHAKISEKDKITVFGDFIANMGIDSTTSWGLILCNLVYTPQFNWWVQNIKLNHKYTPEELHDMLCECVESKFSRKNIISAFKIIFHTNSILSNEIGFGIVDVIEKGNNIKLQVAYRSHWTTPAPLVILYSLYKFAKACEVYQFSVENLLDDEIERDGVSPTRIFGLDKEAIVSILNGLSTKYPDFINATFTLDMDSVTLYKEKTAEDVLSLF